MKKKGFYKFGLLYGCLVSFAVASFFGCGTTKEKISEEEQMEHQIKVLVDDYSTFHDENQDGYGEFEGWGTSLCWWANRLGYSEKMTQQAASLFFGEEGLHLNIGRYNVGGGDDVCSKEELEERKENDPFVHETHIKRSDSAVPGYCVDVTKMDLEVHPLSYYEEQFERADEESGYAWNYDWNADERQMNITIAAAKAYGIGFICEAFSNSPPYFMTVSGCSSGNIAGSMDNLRKDCYTAFASYMADVIAYINQADNGISISSTDPMNEPYTDYWSANSPKQEGCHFDMGNSQSQILVALHEELSKKGLDVIISAGDETSIDLASLGYNSLSDEAKTVVGRIDTHSYQGSKRTALKELAEKEKRNLWMSEVDGDYMAGTNAGDMSCPLGFAEQVMKDVSELKCSAWIFWNLVDMNVDAENEWDADSIEQLGYHTDGAYWGLAIGDHNEQSIVLTKKYYAYGQFTRYITPGMTILGTDGGQSLAAYDFESKRLVIVCLNTEAEDQSYYLNLNNFKVTDCSIQAIRTSGPLEGENAENWTDVTDSDDIEKKEHGFIATLKGNSITTYIIDNIIF